MVIIDNGSSAGAIDELHDIPGARVVEIGRNAGFAAAVNRAMTATQAADVTLILNSDTEVHSGAVAALASAARRAGVALAAPRLVRPDGAVDPSAYHRFPSLGTTLAMVSSPLAFAYMALGDRVRHPMQMRLADRAKGIRPAWVSGAVIAIPRRAWLKVGPFDEGFFLYYEETDWQRRARAAGLVPVLEESATVLHLHRGGDPTAAVPSPHLLDSAVRYHTRNGVPPWATRTVLAVALLGTTAHFSIYLLVPARRLQAHRVLSLSRAALRHLLGPSHSPSKHHAER